MKKLFLIFAILLAPTFLWATSYDLINLEIIKNDEFGSCSSFLQNCSITVSQNLAQCLPTPGKITIKNNSKLNAKNISAFSIDPNFTNYVIQHNQCPASLPPYQSCTIVFYTNAPVAFSLFNIVVKGSNTNSSYFNMEAISCTFTHTVGGTITGLLGAVGLQNNGVDQLIQNANGSFTFPTPIAEGSSYNVTIQTHPVNQTCTVANGIGVMGGNNVTNVVVSCGTNTHSVGGLVTGLTGTLVLQNNGADNLNLDTSGNFTFPTVIAEGSPYNVSVLTQPVNQLCTIINSSGIIGNADIVNVEVNCIDTTTLSVSSPTVTIQANTGSSTLTVTNTGTLDAQNVSAVLPPTWNNVIQDSSECLNITPGNSCQLHFSSPLPYIAQGNIAVTGNNISSPPSIAIAFTISGYYVFSINTTLGTATVRDSSDLPDERWGAPGITSAISLTNGASNTNLIINTPGIGANAALNCYNNTSGGAPVGTWYLPAIQQLGGSPAVDNIDTNLVQLGFGNDAIGFSTYWSSTQQTGGGPGPGAYFWIFNNHSQVLGNKVNAYAVACVREIAY
ncbi:hypothetical protein ACD661_11825 [Legionella lytica]|uniref:Transmembrane protein n=1 Tax=Legionella lytica TaxID=96232 RepID=A0ABW8DCI8_9GAMM